MIDAAPSLWDTAPASSAPHQRPKARRHCLAVATPLEATYATRGAWIRALLAEYTAGHDSERRSLTYADKPTTSAHERLHLLELAEHHRMRQEMVVLALTARMA